MSKPVQVNTAQNPPKSIIVNKVLTPAIPRLIPIGILSMLTDVDKSSNPKVEVLNKRLFGVFEEKAA